MSPIMSKGGERERHFGVGIAQSRVLAILKNYSEGNFATTIAERSPLGQRTLRVRPPGDTDAARVVACEKLSCWLANQPWVEAVIARGPHVYLRIRTETLCSWVTAGSDGNGPTPEQEGRDQVVVLQLPGSGANFQRSLDEFREFIVGRAVAALLGSRGYDVMLNPMPVPDRAATALATTSLETRKISLCTFRTIELSSANNCDSRHAQVGGVDVPHGRLRARHGGTVSADDLLGELREDLLTEYCNFPALVDSAALREQCAELLLAFVLLRIERARRVQLDDAKLRSESAVFAALLEGRQLAAAGIGPPQAGSAAVGLNSPGSDRAVRDLAVEIDLLPLVAARAVNELEPSLIARYVRSLSERTQAARPYLIAADPLWLATGRAIDTALSLIGLNVPPEVWTTRPVAQAHWTSFPRSENMNERK